MGEIVKFPSKPLTEKSVDDLLAIIEGLRGGNVLAVACVIIGKEDDGSEVVFTQYRGTATWHSLLAGTVALQNELMSDWREEKTPLEEA